MSSSYLASKMSWTKSFFDEIFVRIDFTRFPIEAKFHWVDCSRWQRSELHWSKTHQARREKSERLKTCAGFIKATHYGDEFTVSSKARIKRQLSLARQRRFSSMFLITIKCRASTCCTVWLNQAQVAPTLSLMAFMLLSFCGNEIQIIFMCCRASESIGVITARRVGSSIECYCEHLLYGKLRFRNPISMKNS